MATIVSTGAGGGGPGTATAVAAGVIVPGVLVMKSIAIWETPAACKSMISVAVR
jgi:hypothetical protein